MVQRFLVQRSVAPHSVVPCNVFFGQALAVDHCCVCYMHAAVLMAVLTMVMAAVLTVVLTAVLTVEVAPGAKTVVTAVVMKAGWVDRRTAFLYACPAI